MWAKTVTPRDGLQEGRWPSGQSVRHDLGTAAIDLPADVAVRDWDSVLRAVKTRLRVTVAERLAATSEHRVHETADRVQASVLECVAVLDQLQTTLEFAAFPVERKGRRQYCASNQVGDAVLLYASVLGPVWEKIQNGVKR